MPSVGEGANRPPEAASAEFDPLKKTEGEEAAPAVEGTAEGTELLVSPTAASHSAAQTLVGVSQAVGDKGDNSRVCGVCGEAGHNRRTCPRPPVGDANKPASADKDGVRSCSICGQPGHNKRTCPRQSSGEGISLTDVDGEGKAAMLNLPNLPMPSATQHSYLQAFAVGTGLMSHPSAAGSAYRTQQDMVMLSANGRVVPAATGKDGAGGKTLEEVEREEQALLERIKAATERKSKAEEELVKIEKEAEEAEAKLAAALEKKDKDSGEKPEPMEEDKAEEEKTEEDKVDEDKAEEEKAEEDKAEEEGEKVAEEEGEKAAEEEKGKDDDKAEDGSRPTRASKRKATEEAASPSKDGAESLASSRPRRTRG